jgi:hypothetical protein
MCKKNQDTTKIGLPNNLHELQDFIDLGGTIIIDHTSLEERGIRSEELLDPHTILPLSQIPKIIESHNISLTF